MSKSCFLSSDGDCDVGDGQDPGSDKNNWTPAESDFC